MLFFTQMTTVKMRPQNATVATVFEKNGLGKHSVIFRHKNSLV